MNPFKTSVFILLAFGLSHSAKGQEVDSTINNRPRKAAILAACLPGMGQVYNKKYWKVPILYAGFGGLIYAVSFNQGEYKRFGDYYKLATDDDPNTVPEFPASPEQLRQRRNYYKKNRDLSVLGMVALYAIQILDANVDAHLSSFDVNEDLSLHLNKPSDFVLSPRPPSLALSLRYSF